MKKILLLFLLVFVGAHFADAQTPPFYNSNAYGGQNSFPLSSTGSNKVQWITGPAQFASGGTGVGTPAYVGLIDTVWLKAGTTRAAPGPGPYVGLTVGFAQNQGTATSWTGLTYATGITTAFAPATATSLGATVAGQWYPIALTTPYLYNPALSLVIEVQQNGYSLGVTTSQSGTTGGRIWGAYGTPAGTGSDLNMANMGVSLASNLSCATPSLGSATFISQDSVTLSWTENNSPAATTWEIEWGPSGFTPTGSPQITTTTNPHGIGGLTQNTSYDFHVRAYCGPNDSSYYFPILNVTTLATCPWPTALNATSVTATSAILDWVENGSATTWNIEIGLAGFAPSGNATFPTMSNPFTLPGLPGNTCFDYYVQSDCGPDSSVWTGPYTFCTLIAPLACPGTSAASVIFSEEFTNTFTGQSLLPQAVLPGWTVQSAQAGNPAWALESNNTGSGSTGPNFGAQGSTGYVYLEVSCVNGGIDTMTSPMIDLTGVAGAARVKWWNHMYGPNSGKLEVFVDNGSTLTSIYSDSGQTQASSAAAWDSVVVNLNSFVGQNIQLRFVGTAANPGGCSGDRGIDQIEIEGCIACAAPTALVASGVTATTAMIGWTQNGSPLNWHLEVVPAGSPPTGVPTDTATTNPYMITGLTLLQSVDVYVRANCDTNGVSSWTGPLTVLPCFPLAGTYTINPSLPASATNFTSFAQADTALLCGVSAPVIFNVDSASGPYIEQVEFDEVTGASATNTITFNGNGAAIEFNGGVNRYTIRLLGSDYFRFNDLTVRGLNVTTTMVMHLMGGTNHNLFTNCRFESPITATSSLNACFTLSGSATSVTTQMAQEADSNIIDGCTFIGGYWGAAFAFSTTSGSNGNEVLNSTFENQYVYGIYSVNGDEFHTEANDLSRATRISLNTYFGVMQDGLSSNSVHERNYVHDMSGTNPTFNFTCYPIYMLADAATPATANVVRNNIVNSNAGNGTHYGIFLNNASNVHCYHNTVSHDGTAAVTGITRGIFQQGTSTALGVQDIQNNIVSVTRNTTGASYGIYLQNALVTSDYNDVFGTPSASFNYGYNGNANQLDLTAWQASLPSVGTNSLDLDPIFSNPAAGNFTPASAGLDNNGDAVGVLTDFYNAVSSRDKS